MCGPPLSILTGPYRQKLCVDLHAPGALQGVFMGTRHLAKMQLADVGQWRNWSDAETSVWAALGDDVGTLVP